MFCWRITKYDPKYRDSRGAFLKNDWISFSEVGDIFEGKKLTIEDYLKVENAYVASVILFMIRYSLSLTRR